MPRRFASAVLSACRCAAQWRAGAYAARRGAAGRGAACRLPLRLARMLQPLRQRTDRGAGQVLAVVEVRMERVLPRPRVGLLARMLRLEALPLTTVPDSPEPVHLLPAGAEVHISISMHQARTVRQLTFAQPGPCCPA